MRNSLENFEPTFFIGYPWNGLAYNVFLTFFTKRGSLKMIFWCMTVFAQYILEDRTGIPKTSYDSIQDLTVERSS